jgi:hypothetical protein
MQDVRAFLRVPPEALARWEARGLVPAAANVRHQVMPLCRSVVPATVLRQHNTQHLSCGDEEPRPNSD